MNKLIVQILIKGSILSNLLKSNKVLLLISMLIAFIACTLRIDNFFLGFDERATLSCAYGFHLGYENNLKYFTKEYFDYYYTLNGVVHATAADNGNAFAFNSLLHFWTKLSGFNLFGLHLFSIFFFIFSLPFFLGILNRTVKDTFVLRLSLFLYCCHPFFIYMSRQIRGYSLSLFLAVATTYLVILFVEEKERKWFYGISYILLISLLPLTHYMFGSLIIAHIIFIIIKYKNQETDRTSLYIMMTAAIVSGTVLLSWLLLAGWQAYSTVLQIQLKSWQDHPADFIHFSFYNLASYLSNLLCFSEGFIFQFMGYRIRTYAILSLPFLWMLYLGYSKKNISQKHLLLFWLVPICMLFSDFILFARSGILITLYPKYNIILMPFLIVVTASAIGYLRTKSTYLVYFFVALTFTVYLWSYTEVIFKDLSYTYGATNISARSKNPYDKIIKVLLPLSDKGDTLMFPSYEHASFYNHADPENKFIQGVDETEDNHTIYLKNGSTRKMIFDFSEDLSNYEYGRN